MSSAIPRSVDDVRNLLESLRDRITDLEQRADARSSWLENVDDRVTDLEDENDQLRKRLATIDARLENVEDGGRGKDARVRELVGYAENKREGDQPAVVLTAGEVKGATGVSRRYSYDLVDDLPDEYHFIISRREATERQYGYLEIDAGAQAKALVVDCEALHSDPDAVNKFTTSREGKGGE